MCEVPLVELLSILGLKFFWLFGGGWLQVETLG